MKLDINEIQHNYIIKIVIFTILLYKRFFRQPDIYKIAVKKFVDKKLPWDINLIINTGVKLNKNEEREIILQDILNGEKCNLTTTVTATFITPLKRTTISIDLKNEEKYLKFIYQ
jgi:hypothetical protein